LVGNNGFYGSIDELTVSNTAFDNNQIAKFIDYYKVKYQRSCEERGLTPIDREESKECGPKV